MTILEAALKYAVRGLCVFPVYGITDGKCDCGKNCGRNAGKHPLTSHGLKDATTDAAQIRNWWAQWPNANVAIRTGAESGIFVLDVDGPEGETFLKDKHIPPTPTARTGKGRHLIFKHPGAIVRNAVKIAPAIDLRGDAGYIVAAPSTHLSGIVYSWADGLSLEEAPLADAPSWLLELMQPKSRSMSIAVDLGVDKDTIIPEGMRNATLASFAGAMRRKGMDADEIAPTLKAVNAKRCSPPLPESEVEDIAHSIGKYEVHVPEILSADTSEDGLALEFARRYVANWRYVAAWGQWLHYDGACWSEESTLLAFDLARPICREAAARCINPNHAAKIASAATVAAVERMAKADRRHAATTDQWDNQPWLLNTPGGVVDLQTAGVTPHDQKYYLTKVTTAEKGAGCPAWLKFLAEITGGNQELQNYLARIAGYALTGVTQEHALFFLYGTGANGKSVFLNTLEAILGDYAKTAAADTFLESKNDRHPTDMAMLRGARMVISNEVDQGRRWAEAKLKSLTGGDVVSARFMRQDFFEYVPQFKLFVAGNYKPSIRGVDEAMRRRIHLVPFTVTIPPEKRDQSLPERLLAERDGILGWAIDGCLEWQLFGLHQPDIVREATDDYFTSEDAIGRWLEETCQRDVNATATTKVLFASWKAWAETAGLWVGSDKRLATDLQTRGFAKWVESGTRHHGFRGLALLVKEAVGGIEDL